MATVSTQGAERRQNSQPITVQISSQLVNFVSGGFLGMKVAMEGSSCSPEGRLGLESGSGDGQTSKEETLENNLPLGKPEYYYFPPELITDSRDFLEPRELSRLRPYGRGLANPGWNICYFNSILQALTYAPYLSIDCLRRSHQRICKHRHDHLVCMMCMFEDHVNLILEAASSEESKAVVSSFVKCAQRLIWKRFRIGMMHDAQEFLRYFLEALHKSCLPKSLQGDHVFRKIHPITASTTYIGHLFCGFFLSRIICSSCRYTSNTYDPFMDIPLDIMGVSNLENALKLFTKTEYLKGENRYICPKCNQRSDASKQLLIERLPPLLTIQLKRFSYVAHGSRKPNKAISFSETLDLEPFLASGSHSNHAASSSPPSSYVYKLWAVVCHAGSTLSCGHYYTYAKSIDNKWYCFNDEYVKPARIENVLNENFKAYLLFYYRSEFNRDDLLRDSGASCSISSIGGGDTRTLAPLAPEISFINLRLKSKSKVGIGCDRSGGGGGDDKSSGPEQNLNEFLDNLLEKRPREGQGGGGTGSAQNQETQNSNDIRLVLTPTYDYPDSKDRDLGQTCPVSRDKERGRGIGRVKSFYFKLRSLLLCNGWMTKPRPRRNLVTILYLKKLKLLGLSSRYFGRLGSGTHDKSRERIPISHISKSNQIETWEDLNLSSDTLQSLEEAQKSLLARSNVRSDYDREYDRGKVKKPLRQAAMLASGCTESGGKKTNRDKEGLANSQIYMGKGNVKNLGSLTTSQLFDIAFKNKANLKNSNKKRTRTSAATRLR